jgi:Holliday junction resolvase RusA-like endonuclease
MLGSLTEPLALIVVTYYASRRPDLDTHALRDSLQAAGVVKDDRYIREIHAFGFLDTENPRSEITLLSIPDRMQIPHPTLEDTYGTF